MKKIRIQAKHKGNYRFAHYMAPYVEAHLWVDLDQIIRAAYPLWHFWWVMKSIWPRAQRRQHD